MSMTSMLFKSYMELVAKNQRLLELLAKNDTALIDWLNIYAEEHCDEERVKEARTRIFEKGGTLAYIADLHRDNTQALGPYAPTRPPQLEES